MWECRQGPCPGGMIETNMVEPAAPKMGASLPKGFLVSSSRMTGISLRAKMMSIASCPTQPISPAVDIGFRASNLPIRLSNSSLLGV